MMNFGAYANVDTNNNFLQAAIYCRLSKEDEERGDNDSRSIITQKDMLTDYVNRRGWNLFKVYSDDGRSGLFAANRPAFQEMLADIKAGKIDIVITKDLSRLGRNYTEMGSYIENFFPKHNIRYIAVNDGVDTYRENNDIIPFKNVLNEFYSRDVSKKVSSGYLVRAKQGKFTGTVAPIGYMKNPDDSHVLIPDPDTDWIVKKIFGWAVAGYGARAIKSKLYDEEIPAPTWWNRQKGLRNKTTKWERERPEDGRFVWDETTITEIVRNPVYIGDMASQKVNYRFKAGWLSDKPKEEWIIVKDTHEPLVSQSTYDIANRKFDSRKMQIVPGAFDNVFQGLVKCPNCGKSLVIKYNNSKTMERIFNCSTYSHHGKKFCSQHRIDYKELYEIVLNDIRKNAESVDIDVDRLVESIMTNLSKEELDERKGVRGKLSQLEKKKVDLDFKVERLYDDWLSKRISENNFQRILNKTQEEQKCVDNELNDLKARFEEDSTPEEYNIRKWVELIGKYKEITELDKEMLNELIDKIFVYEKEIDDEGGLYQVVEIHYNFIGNCQDIVLNYDL